MKDIKPIRVHPGIGRGRPVLRDLDDIRRQIGQTPKPDIVPDRTIKLGTCGFEMPVLRSHWALSEMRPGEVLRMESGHT
ncbi:MAG: hypothetical protein ACNS63_03910 [Candidatus Nitrospinota bacterium M3_3B_026]